MARFKLVFVLAALPVFMSLAGCVAEVPAQRAVVVERPHPVVVERPTVVERPVIVVR